MTCSRFEPEAYSLYAINVLDPPEAEVIGSHLAAGCDTCNKGVREAAQFWYRFASMDVQQSRETPSPAVGERLLEQVRACKVTALPARRLPGYWIQAVAASVAVAMIGSAWYGGRHSVVIPRVVVSPQGGEVARLRSEIERLRAQLRTPITTVVPTVVPTVVVRNNPVLHDVLANAQARLDSAIQSLAGEQARGRQLDQELQNQKALYAGALKERDQLQNSDRTRLIETQRQLTVVSSRMEALERQNSEYRLTLARQQKELDQNLRMVSFLSSPSLRVVKLQATDKGAEAVGQVYVEEGQKLVFNAARLPALTAGRAYQLWVIRGHAPAIVSAGVFSPDASGRGTVQFEDPSLLRDIRALAVTEEPKGGSTKPTGHKMMIGSSKS